jgi:Tol biopolymer transport system component
MAVVAPPRSPEPEPVDADALDALIEEARRRARRRRMGYAACALVALAGTAIFLGLRGGGGINVRSQQDESSALLNARSAPPQRGSSGLIAVSRVYRGESHILLVDPSGRSAPRDLGPGWGPSWSPDGRKLVFGYEVGRGGRDLGGGLERLFVMNADGSGRRPLPMPPLGSPRFEAWAPAWSPDGNRIAFTRRVWPAWTDHTGRSTVCCLGRSAIYVLDLVHRGLRRVSMPAGNEEVPAYATWSPNGRRLAYLAPASGLAPPCIGLHVSNADGTSDHVLAAASRSPDAPHGCVPIWTPAWSPDGHWIAFARSTNAGGIDLYLISRDGRHLHRLTHQPNFINGSPTWSADGKRIAFSFGPPEPLWQTRTRRTRTDPRTCSHRPRRQPPPHDCPRPRPYVRQRPLLAAPLNGGPTLAPVGTARPARPSSAASPASSDRAGARPQPPLDDTGDLRPPGSPRAGGTIRPPGSTESCDLQERWRRRESNPRKVPSDRANSQ